MCGLHLASLRTQAEPVHLIVILLIIALDGRLVRVSSGIGGGRTVRGWSAFPATLLVL